MDIRCDRCKEKLEEPGGLAFSPPQEHAERYQLCSDSQPLWSRKVHLCQSCWYDFDAWVDEGREE